MVVVGYMLQLIFSINAITMKIGYYLIFYNN